MKFKDNQFYRFERSFHTLGSPLFLRQ